MEVWNANVYFDDRSGAKNRPVIVLEKRGEDFTVYMVTSHPHHPETDIRLMDPYEVMLDRTSHIRTDRPFKLPASKFNYKLKGLTGETPTHFFMKYKLNKAAELLRSGKYNVSEVADLTGFGTVSHFSVSFKKHFGVNPKDYK